MRGLNQPTLYAKYEAGDVGDSEDDSGCSTDDDSRSNEDDVIDNPSLDDEIPRQIVTVDVDDDGVKLHLLFWTACNAYTKHVYKQTMDVIKRESKKAYGWLVDESIEHWARFTSEMPDNTTNFVKSFNGKIEKYRCKHVFIMFEAGKVVSRVKLLLVKAKQESRGCRLTPTSEGVFDEIEGATQFTLKLKEVDPKLRGEGISLRKERTSLEATLSSVAFVSNLAIIKKSQRAMCPPDFKRERQAKLQGEDGEKESWVGQGKKLSHQRN
ncbi:hypothetical protein Cgig2_021454 [Carnegiea gigantea]|uniref:Uncharacterized protein n=1 Tax=Carnegiea gigantea TaxID=171969 RepID=A0A9Q1K0H4_9CARY|nr:hypothetical protein Cgig2_021454 [Carnegiea gigantea]